MIQSGFNYLKSELADLPLRLKYSAEYLPDKATAGGILPSSSMIWAIWSDIKGDSKHGIYKFTKHTSINYINNYNVISFSPLSVLVILVRQ